MKQTGLWQPAAEQALIQGCAEFGISLTTEQLAQFSLFANLLIEANQHINLTSITDPREIAIKHFVDSLSAFRVADFDNGSVIDVGTGGGVPGIPIKILRPALAMTFLDSTRKKLNFLQEAATRLELQDCHFVWSRAEEAAHGELREAFDYALGRALGNMSLVCELCLPLLKVHGKLVAFKGPEGHKELPAAEKACKVLGARIVKKDEFTLPLTNHRRLLFLIVKERETDSRYPRDAAEIRKNPLS